MNRRARGLAASAVAAWPLILSLSLPVTAIAATGAGEGPLHVPSPDWRDQIVYFLMIDRFDDGDPSNNDQGAGEYDPADGAKFSGGDLRGVARRVDYIRGLGATAVWITPPVANQWWNERVRYGGYHGYWAEDFAAVDAHFGTLDDYRALSRELHGAGMYLIQDVVVNHTGDFFHYDENRDPGDPARGFARIADSRGRIAPSQAPFDRNDARDPRDRAAAIYHWTPDIADFGDRRQELDCQLAGLDDLNTENADVREALRRSYGGWIEQVGVDGFRIDTAFYVPQDYFADFLNADDPQAPGVLLAAARTGREGFHVFGEGFGIDRAYEDAQARKIEGYATGADGEPLLPGMINFPLYGTIGDVFARGHATTELGHRIRSTMAVHARPHLMPTFVDNHDVDRFLAGGDEAGLKQALLAILTLPGIPTIYYGTEQGFTRQRQAMFAGGHGAGGRDRFDREAPLYRYLQRAIALRRGDRTFSRGTPTVLAESGTGPGAFAYRMDYAGESALVVFNTSDAETLLAGMDTGLPPGTRLAPRFAVDGAQVPLTVDADGRVTLALPPRAGLAWKAAGSGPVPQASPVRLSIDPLPAANVDGDFAVSGIAHGVRRFRLVLDGDLSSAKIVTPGRDGRWRATVDTAGLVDPAVEHRLVAAAEAGRPRSPGAAAGADTTWAVSEPLRFFVEPRWTTLAEAEDPAGDDRGPGGDYVYPVDASWRGRRPLDILGVRVAESGGSLRIELRMRELMAAWNPANGFDHLTVTLFLELPDREGGATVMPLQNATLPDGMRWHYRLRAGGWSNAMFSAEGAGPDREGTPVAPAARLSVDPERGVLSLTVPATAIGRPASLSGARLYVATWDYDGGYRTLSPEPQGHGFGGGDGARDPLVMDDVLIVVP